jgi:hypothetical protein
MKRNEYGRSGNYEKNKNCAFLWKAICKLKDRFKKSREEARCENLACIKLPQDLNGWLPYSTEQDRRMKDR